MKQLRNGDWAGRKFKSFLHSQKSSQLKNPIAPPQPIFFPKFQIFFADFPNSTFLPLARDCASWEPAADISTARFVNEWYFSSSPRFSRLDEKRLLIYKFFVLNPRKPLNFLTSKNSSFPKLSKECNKNILFSWVKISVLRTSLIRKKQNRNEFLSQQSPVIPDSEAKRTFQRESMSFNTERAPPNYPFHSDSFSILN